MAAKSVREWYIVRAGAREPNECIRTSASSANPLPKVVQAKPFDWTFTTTYCGHLSNQASGEPAQVRYMLHYPRVSLVAFLLLSRSPLKFSPADPQNPKHCIPIAELSRPDPILFFTEIPLFEDELHDNGYASYFIRAVS